MYKSIRFKVLVILLSMVVLYGLTIVFNLLYNYHKDKINNFNNDIKIIELLMLKDAIAVNNFFIFETKNNVFFLTGNSYYIEEHNIYMSGVCSKLLELLNSEGVDKFSVRNELDLVSDNIQNYKLLFNNVVKKTKQIHDSSTSHKNSTEIIRLKEELDEYKNSILLHITNVSAQVSKQQKDLFGELRYYFGTALFVLIVVGVIVSIIVSKETTKRITMLSKVIEKYVNSKFTDTEDYGFKQRADEVGKLVDNFLILRREVWLQINHLEENVEKRTHRISEQNKRINEQKEEIIAQRDDMIKKNVLIEKQSNNILDSIRYAQRIQESFLPNIKKIKNVFPESFVLWKPKAIVSGDFYWFKHYVKKHFSIMVVADCTGHGVPGGFMSILGNALLNEIVLRKKFYDSPAIILNLMRKRLIDTLKAENRHEYMNEAIDLSLIKIDHLHKKLIFAGANRPIIIIRNNELKEIKGDRMPIGSHVKGYKSFTDIEYNYREGDCVYTYSDGFPDQFCLNNKNKFMNRRLKQMLLDNHHHPMDQQVNIYAEIFDQWKGTTEQTDDVLLTGIKLT